MATPTNSTSTGRVEEVRQWLADHGDLLYAFALARVKSRAVAEDLVQDVMLAALESGERFEGRASPRTWLVSILKHKLMDHFRRLGRSALPSAEVALQRFVEERFDDRGVWRVKPAADPRKPRSELERAELAESLQRCLEKLPPRVCEAFLLVERDGRSADNVSQALGLTTTNVWTMLYRARVAMRQCMESAQGEPGPGSRG